MDQLETNRLRTVYSSELTYESLTKCLNNVIAKHPSPNYTIYTSEKGAEWFWDLAYDRNSIKLYGIKHIQSSGKENLYEAIVFDNFPKDKECYSISHDNVEEEVSIEIISDTCIRFILTENCTEPYEFRLIWTQ